MNYLGIFEVHRKRKGKEKRAYTLARRAKNSCTATGPAQLFGRVHRSLATSKAPAGITPLRRLGGFGRSRFHLNDGAQPPGR